MSTDKNRSLTYAQAIDEALMQSMAADRDVFVIGLGVTDYKGIFGTTININKRFGPGRVIEVPASENALTGVVIGASAFGKKPVIVHARNDFMFLTLDEMINAAAKWKYMYGGRSRVSFVVRGIIGKGWGQGPTHSQSIQSVFLHFPGIRVAMPSTPEDAKGFMIAGIKGQGPCVILEHRTLYNSTGHVPKGMYESPFGKARRVRSGSDITVVAVSLMVEEAVKAHIALKRMGISLEVIDPRSLNPLDEKSILLSVKKTGRLIVADTSWTMCGFSSEIAALAAEKAYPFLKAPVARIGLPACPSPVSKTLEDAFYPTYKDIFAKACGLMGRKPKKELVQDPVIDNFKGPY